MMKESKFLMVLFIFAASFLTACSDDDDGGNPVIAPTGSIVVDDQTLMNGTVTISNVEISEDGWLVIYEDNAGVLGTEILGYVQVGDGSHEDVTVELDDDVELTSGDVLWAALHVDSDRDGQFDWDGITGTDLPVQSGSTNLAESFIVTIDENSVTAEDQAVVDNTITISNVNLQEAGWIVVHNDEDGAAGEVIGVSEVLTAGSHDDVEITFEESAEVSVGDVLWIMLHADTGAAGVYEFDGSNGLDLPLTGDNGPVMVSITITE